MAFGSSSSILLNARRPFRSSVDSGRWRETTRSSPCSASWCSSRSSTRDPRTRSGRAPTRTRSRRSRPTAATSRRSPSASCRRSPASAHSTARKIREFFEKGTIGKLEELRRKVSAGLRRAGPDPRRGSEDARAAAQRARRFESRRAEERAREPEGARAARPRREGGGEAAPRDRANGQRGPGGASPDLGRDADRAGVRGCARGAARGRARAILRQPAPAARDGRRRRHRGGFDASRQRCARRS